MVLPIRSSGVASAPLTRSSVSWVGFICVPSAGKEKPGAAAGEIDQFCSQRDSETARKNSPRRHGGHEPVASHRANAPDRVPAKAGTHSSVARASDKWIPAFAGTRSFHSPGSPCVRGLIAYCVARERSPHPRPSRRVRGEGERLLAHGTEGGGAGRLDQGQGALLVGHLR